MVCELLPAPDFRRIASAPLIFRTASERCVPPRVNTKLLSFLDTKISSLSRSPDCRFNRVLPTNKEYRKMCFCLVDLLYMTSSILSYNFMVKIQTTKDNIVWCLVTNTFTEKSTRQQKHFILLGQFYSSSLFGFIFVYFVDYNNFLRVAARFFSAFISSKASCLYLSAFDWLLVLLVLLMLLIGDVTSIVRVGRWILGNAVIVTHSET